jgi:CDP-glucose 4,6-dehydratase
VEFGRRALAGLGLTTVDPRFWRDRRVLVTGHTGFKGAWLSLWLQSLGASVTGFAGAGATEPSLYELAQVGEGMQSIAGDVCDPGAVAQAVDACQAEVVFHAAAQALVRRSLEEPRQTYETNVMGTVNVLDAVRLHGDRVRAVVCVTSDKCYENREWEWGYRESEPLGGSDPYSSSKGCAELVTAAFRDSFFASPSSARSSSRHPAGVASARAGNVIGGGDWGADRLVPDVMRAALSGQPIRVRNPNSVRPWQHVLNPLAGYLMLAQSLWASPEYANAWNFGPLDEDARPVGWLVEQIAEMWPGSLTWVLDEGPHPPEARYLKLDSSRARTHLGWRPPVGLEQGLEAIVEWYRELDGGADMRGVTVRQIDRLVGSRVPG